MHFEDDQLYTLDWNSGWPNRYSHSIFEHPKEKADMKAFIGVMIVLILLFGVTACNLQMAEGTSPGSTNPVASDGPMIRARLETSCRTGPG